MNLINAVLGVLEMLNLSVTVELLSLKLDAEAIENGREAPRRFLKRVNVISQFFQSIELEQTQNGYHSTFLLSRFKCNTLVLTVLYSYNQTNYHLLTRPLTNSKESRK